MSEPKDPAARKPEGQDEAASAREPAEGSEPDSGTDGEHRGTGRLPAFGFAADVLPGSSGAALDTGPIDPHDPDRIYAFADALDDGSDDATQSGPAPRIETWVTFALDTETYALPVHPIQEVLRVASITRVPHAPEPIRGVTQLRGRVIPVIDLRQRLGLPTREALGRSSRILVVSSKRRLLGLLVDRVFQVEHIDLNRVQPPPDDVVSIRSDFIFGVDQRDDTLLLLLDADRVLVVHDRQESA